MLWNSAPSWQQSNGGCERRHTCIPKACTFQIHLWFWWQYLRVDQARGRLAFLVARLNSLMLAASFHRYLGICPHGPQSSGRALTRTMTKNTERQRARLKAPTRCLSGNKLRLRDIIVRPKTLKTYHISASRFLFFCSDRFGRWPQLYIDLDFAFVRSLSKFGKKVIRNPKR